jgi:putative tryptophan/tyrosine transport system substrate-binding protein
VKRREFFAFLGGTVAWPLYLSAQRPPKLVRIGYLSLGTAATTARLVEALWSGLRELWYVEGENFLLEYRRAEEATQLAELAADLVRANVDVIFRQSCRWRGRLLPGIVLSRPLHRLERGLAVS